MSGNWKSRLPIGFSSAKYTCRKLATKRTKDLGIRRSAHARAGRRAVSYTHLTLPTICSV
eukprot:15390416-Alexandrium_andersonii.AAC.1